LGKGVDGEGLAGAGLAVGEDSADAAVLGEGDESCNGVLVYLFG